MQTQQTRHNRQNGTPAIVPTRNGPLLRRLPQSLTDPGANEPSICAKWSMRSSTARKPDVNGGCCQKTFLTGGMYGTTTICGLKMVPGKVSTMRCGSRCVVRMGVIQNHH